MSRHPIVALLVVPAMTLLVGVGFFLPVGRALGDSGGFRILGWRPARVGFGIPGGQAAGVPDRGDGCLARPFLRSRAPPASSSSGPCPLEGGAVGQGLCHHRTDRTRTPAPPGRASRAPPRRAGRPLVRAYHGAPRPQPLTSLSRHTPGGVRARPGQSVRAGHRRAAASRPPARELDTWTSLWTQAPSSRSPCASSSSES